jgi:LysM repeat protein
MSPDKNTSPKICPTCGTRLSENATRCLVCGRAITATATPRRESDSSVQGPRMPTLTLSLPLAIGLFMVLIALGAGAVYLFARSTPQIVVDFTATPTSTQTSTVTPTSSPTATSTAVPTATPLPDKEYVVKAGDSCLAIAYLFNVSVNTIVLKNNLPADCSSLSVGKKLLIPQPTITPTSLATSTSIAANATDKACELFAYTVKEGDTLSSISANHNVPGVSIREYNSLPSDIVQLGQRLNIPLCKRNPTPGPTSTPTPPPPYNSPYLLLPADGASFVATSDVITLQWSSVGNMRQNESYWQESH